MGPLEVPVLFCTGVGVAENRQEVSSVAAVTTARLCVAVSAAGFRRRALFWKVDAGFSQPNMIDSPVANIASSGLLL